MTSEMRTGFQLMQRIPGLALLHNYRRKWLAADLVAGMSVCLVTIPSAIAYAELMGLAPQHGLYAALIPLLVYPLLTTSRHVIAGPDIAISLLIASAIVPLAQGDSARAATLAATLALFSGVFLTLGARVRIGAVADFFSKPVLVGYMTGAAMILVASQLNKLFGLQLKNGDFFPRLIELVEKLPQTHALTLLFGLGLLALLFFLHRVAPKLPSTLIVCLVAGAISSAFGFQERGVSVVGAVPRGLPAFAMPAFDWLDLRTLLPAAIGIALLTYTEGILLARAFAAKHSYEVDANQELVALGVADIFTGLFQGFSITGSQSRTIVNNNADAKTQLAGLVAALSLGAFILFLTPWVARLPQVALAVILIYGGFTLVEFQTMHRIYRYYPRAAVNAALTTFGVLALGVIEGILVGVALSLLGLINRVSRPSDAVLREVPGHGFHDLGGEFPAQTIPGLVVYRFYAPLLFSNASYFVQRVRQLTQHTEPQVRWFLLDAQAITDIDLTAAEALHAVHRELQRKHVILKIAHANRPFRSVLEQTGLARELGGFFSSVHEGVAAFHAAQTQAGELPKQGSGL